jgi:hypothetical protein
MNRWSVRLAMGLALATVGCGPRAEEPAPPKASVPVELVKPEMKPVTAETKPAKPASNPAELWAWAPKPEGPPRILVTVVYDDGSVSGLVDNRDVRVGEKTFKLSQLRRWRRAGKGLVEPAEGLPIEGNVEGLNWAGLTVGGRPQRLELTRASDLLFEAPEGLAPVPGLDGLRNGRFVRPYFSLSPVTSFRSVHGRDNSPGGLKLEAFDDKERVRISSTNDERIDVLFYGDGPTPPVNLLFCAPTAAPLEIGKLYDSRGVKFVVWEAERSNGPEARNPGSVGHVPFDRLAIDYVASDRAGSIRLNSSFK